MLRYALFGFRGRLDRLSWLGWQVVSLLIGLVVAGVGGVMLAAGNTTHHANTGVGLAVLVLGTIWLVWSSVALGAKRLHDMNLSGLHLVWICALVLAPAVLAPWWWAAGAVCGLLGLAIGLGMACRPGDVGINRFGVSALRRNAARRRLAEQRRRDRHDPPELRRDPAPSMPARRDPPALRREACPT